MIYTTWPNKNLCGSIPLQISQSRFPFPRPSVMGPDGYGTCPSTELTLQICPKQRTTVFDRNTILMCAKVQEIQYSINRECKSSTRSCGDIEVTAPDTWLCQHPLRSVFLKMGMVKIHHQIFITGVDISKTAIETPLSTFEFNYMSVGLSNVVWILWLFIDEVLWGLMFALGYTSDMLLADSTPAEHVVRPRQLS